VFDEQFIRLYKLPSTSDYTLTQLPFMMSEELCDRRILSDTFKEADRVQLGSVNSFWKSDTVQNQRELSQNDVFSQYKEETPEQKRRRDSRANE